MLLWWPPSAASTTCCWNLACYSPNYSVEVLFHGLFQDFVVVTILEPGTYALMIAGLAGMSLIARRRKAQPA